MTKKKKNIIAISGFIVAVAVIFFIAWTDRSVAPTAGLNSAGSAASTSEASSSVLNVAASSTGAASSSGPALSVSFKRFYQGSSFSFSYPPSWTILDTLPFSMTNFNGAYGPNQTLPPGGAQIDIVTTTAAGGLQNIIGTELLGVQNLTMATTSVDGTACAQARYESSSGSGGTAASVALYCERTAEIWKIYLVYRANDPATAEHLADFQTVLGTMKLIP